MRILVVEDDERIIGFIKRGLEGEDFLVDSALTQSEALRALASQQYDAMVLDVFLGSDNGLELCRDLRNEQNFIPIVVLSAMGSPDMRRRSFLAGADEFLAKPFAFDDLISKIQTVIQMNADAIAARGA